MEKETLKNVKILAGQFQEEMKGSSLFEFIIWLDCKLEYSNHIKKQMREKYPINSTKS